MRFIPYMLYAVVLTKVLIDLWEFVVEDTITPFTGAFPSDIILMKILPKLPTKSIGRCMCVCKEWKSYLSTPKFAKIHLHQHVNRSHKLLIFDPSLLKNGNKQLTLRTVDCDAPNVGFTTVREVTYSSLPYPHSFLNSLYVLSSFDGLVCLASPLTKELALWNPLTGAFKSLPENSYSPHFYNRYSDVLGFYMDSFNDDYKLLHIIVSKGFLGAYVYSLKMDSWKKIEYLVDNIDHRSDYSWTPATLLGQCLYFVVWERYANQRCIICFDVKSEKFRKKQFPPVPISSSQKASLVVLDGCVHLCVSYIPQGSHYLSNMEAGTWRMDGDDGWVKVKAFSFEKYNFSRIRKVFSKIRKVSISRNENWFAIAENKKGLFYIIDMKDFAASYVCLRKESLFKDTEESRTIYVETLVSPNM